jgi:hypothetical protein
MISVISDCVLATVRTIAFISVLLVIAPFTQCAFQSPLNSYNKVVGVLAGILFQFRQSQPITQIPSAIHLLSFIGHTMVVYRT